MLVYPILAFCLLVTVCATPTGNHTCTGVVKHEVTVKVNVTEPVTFRAYEWCLRVPPRCSTYTIQLKDRVKIHKELHNRTITVCCKGYVEIDYKCVPACPPEMECPNMHCNRTNHCYCTPGYTGLYCDHPCPKGYWGAGCIKECDCPTGYTCHHLTGDCMLDDSPPPKTRKTTTRAAAEEEPSPSQTAFPTTPTTTTTVRTTTFPTTSIPTTTFPTTPRTVPTTTLPTTPTTIPTTTFPTTPSTIPTTTFPTTPTIQTTTFPTTQTTIPTTASPTTPTNIPTTTPPTPRTNPTTTVPPTTTETEHITKAQATAAPTIMTEITTASTTLNLPSSQPPTTTETVATTTEKIAATTTTSTIPEPTTSTTEQPTEPLATFPSSTATKKTTTTIRTSFWPTTITSSTTTTEKPTTLLIFATKRADPTAVSQTTTTTTEKNERMITLPNQLGNFFRIEDTTSTFGQLITEATSTTHPPTTVVPTTDATTVETQTAKPKKRTTTAPTATSSTSTAPEIVVTQPSFTHKTDHTTDSQVKRVQIAPDTSWSNQLYKVWQNLTDIPLTSIDPIMPGIPKIASTRPTTTPSTETPTTSTPSTPAIIAPITKSLDLIPTRPKPASEHSYTDRPVFWLSNITVTSNYPPIRTLDVAKSESSTVVPSTRYFDTRQPPGRFPAGGRPDDISNRNPLFKTDDVARTTTDRLDRLIIEDVLQHKPTTDTSPIKLVEEVINKYFPELKPRSETTDTIAKKELDLGPKTESPLESGSVQLTKFQAVVEQSKKAQISEKQDLEKFKLSKVVSSFSLSPHQKEPFTIGTTSTPSPSSTPKLSTNPVITPRVIVSAKNPDEIDFGGVIYRKMKLFPPSKTQKEFKPAPTAPPQTTAIVKSIPTEKPSVSASSGERFKLYLPEFGKALEKDDDSSTESSVKTFLPKFNHEKEETDFNKQHYQSKKAKPKEKDSKKYKSKSYEFSVAPTSAEEGSNERVTNNVFLETKEFKVHLTSTKPQQFDQFHTKPPVEFDGGSFPEESFMKKGNKQGHLSENSGATSIPRFPKFTELTHRATVPLPSGTFTSGEELQQPTTNPKPPHTWYSHAREKAKIKSALKVAKSTTLDMNNEKPPTEDPLGILDESNDINSLVTQDHHNGDDRYSSEREARSAAAAVTYQEDLNNPLMLRGQVKFNAPESLASSSWIAQDGSMLGSTVAVIVAVCGATMLILSVAVALWLRMRSRGGRGESANSEGSTIGGRSSASPANQPPQHYETLYPLTHPAEEMEVATFFCPTFTNNYAERINKEFSELSYDHPRNSFEPLYAEILHPKIKDTE